MMDKIGGSAFPLATGWVETTGARWQKIVVVRELDRGMSLRDYFAAHAPAPPDWYILAAMEASHGKQTCDVMQDRAACELAWPYVWANAQIAERAK